MILGQFISRVIIRKVAVHRRAGRNLVVDSFRRLSILEITKLTTDSGAYARTLRQFRNFMNASVKEEYQDDYRQFLKQASFNRRIERLIDTAKRPQDTQIAHPARPKPGDQVDALTIGEIKEIVGELTELFEVASFDTEYRYLIGSY
jgi:hypothetical protein